MVEAFRNICGATLLKNGYEDYEEFNLKKFQTTHCSHTSTSNLVSFKPTIKAEDEDDLENTHDSADADLEVKSESTANILTTPAG